MAYEVLLNYDSPGAASAFWNSVRMGQLPLETRRVCQAFYPQEGERVGAARPKACAEIIGCLREEEAEISVYSANCVDIIDSMKDADDD